MRRLGYVYDDISRATHLSPATICNICNNKKVVSEESELLVDILSDIEKGIYTIDELCAKHNVNKQFILKCKERVKVKKYKEFIDTLSTDTKQSIYNDSQVLSLYELSKKYNIDAECLELIIKEMKRGGNW